MTMNYRQSQVTQSAGFGADGRHVRLTVTGLAGYFYEVRKVSRKLSYLFVVLIISLVVAGCSKANTWDDPGPKESFETFMMNLWRGNQSEAFEAVWPEDQKWLTAAGAGLEKDFPKIPALKPEEWLVVSRLDNPLDIRRLEIVSDTKTGFSRGDRVSLELQYFDDRVGQVEMVWGGERWYVALPEPSAKAQSAVDVVRSGKDVDNEALLLLDDEMSNGND